jgi:transglutaminase-like putative cysteine protease
MVLRHRISRAFTSLRAAFLLFCSCALALSASQRAFAKPSFAVKPPQSWIRTVDFRSEAQDKPTSASSSSTFLLDDHQTRVSEKSVERYYHHAQRIDTAAGLGDVSQLKFYFEPSYQQLTIHFIRIQRGNAFIDALRPSEIKVIQQEESLSQQLYNGTLAALVFLNDIRVGDIVDYSYTVSGENPVLNGRFADTFYLADQQPIQHLSYRLIWPSQRTLAVKNENTEIAPAVHEVANESEYVWERRNVIAISVDDATPDWYDPYPTVSLSEFQTWQDVTQWALPLYGATTLDAPELNLKIRKWEADFGSPEQRTVAALRFVQDEIRYLGIELGRYSHQPTLPAKVFARRFGDCKDKSMLLAILLKSMGIDAAPALVNSSAGRSLDNRQPSPFAFDHVIVQAKIGGKTYWLDPTISYQRGGLDKYYDPPYERALVLRPDTTALEKIPLPALSSGSIIVSENYDGPSGPGPISLLVRTTYLGAEADSMRYLVSGSSLAELSKSYLNFYASANPSIRAAGLPQVEDDQASNTIVMTEKYLIDEFWKDTKHYFVADKIYSEIGKPDVSQRSMPLRMRYPLSISQTIEINLAESYRVPLDRGKFSDDALRFEYAYSVDGNLIKLEYSLKTFADSIPTEKVPQHLLVLDRIRDFVGFELTRGSDPVRGFPTGRSTHSNRFLNALVGLVIFPMLLILAILVIRRRLIGRRRILFGGELKAKVGSTPETAIRLRRQDEIDSVLRNFKCDCEHHPYKPESPPPRERFTYDGRRLVGIRLRCDRCLKNSDLYVDVGTDQVERLTTLQTDQ